MADRYQGPRALAKGLSGPPNAIVGGIRCQPPAMRSRATLTMSSAAPELLKSCHGLRQRTAEKVTHIQSPRQGDRVLLFDCFGMRDDGAPSIGSGMRIIEAIDSYGPDAAAAFCILNVHPV